MDRKEELLALECPVAITQDVIGGKWKIMIIWRLKDGAVRFNQLQKTLPGIQQSALTSQLRELERDGLIHREIYKEIPPKVEYSLTDMGKKLLKVVYRLGEWGIQYSEFLKTRMDGDTY